MIDFHSLLLLQSQIIILSAVGFFLKRKKILKQEFQDGLTDLLIDVILPCNIIASFEVEFNLQILKQTAEILLISIGVQICCGMLNRFLYRKTAPDRRPVLQFGTICSNAGFLGTPIVEGVFGSAGMLLASVFLIPQRIMIWTAGISIFTQKQNGKFPWKRIVTHPCIVAVGIGLLLMFTQFVPPDYINTPLIKIGNCTLQMSMILIGMIISDVKWKDFLDRDILYYCALRLALIPALTFLCCTLAHTAALSAAVGTVLTAMPMGATAGILAAKYRYAEKFAVGTVAVSTLLSIVTTPLWCLLLG